LGDEHIGKAVFEKAFSSTILVLLKKVSVSIPKSQTDNFQQYLFKICQNNYCRQSTTVNSFVTLSPKRKSEKEHADSTSQKQHDKSVE